MGTLEKREGKSIGQNMAWYSAGSVIYLACQWFLSVVVARMSAGFDDAGALALAMSIGNIFTPLAYYNTRTYQVSDVKGEYSNSQYVAFRLVTTLAAFVACAVYTVLTAELAVVPVIAFLVYKIVVVIIDILHGVDQQHSRLDYAGISLIAQGVTSLGFFTLVFWLTQSLTLAICAMTVTAFLVLCLFDWRMAGRLDDIRPRIGRAEARSLAKACLPAVLSGVLCSAAITVSRQFLFVMEGESSLGSYASVATLAVIVQMAASYIYNPLLGTFATLAEKQDGAALRRLILRVCLAVVGITLVVSLLFWLFGEWGLKLLFGEKIIPFVGLLQPMLLCTAATAYLWFFMDLLIVLRKMKEVLVGNVVAFVAVFPLSYGLIMACGANGVSFAGAIAYALGCVLLARYTFSAIGVCCARVD